MIVLKKTNGQATIEFIVILTILLAGLIVFQKYIARGLYGRWKGIGDSFGQGRVFDPERTIECSFDDIYHRFILDRNRFQNDPDGEGGWSPRDEAVLTTDNGVWYDKGCYERRCENRCEKTHVSKFAKYIICRECIDTCVTAECSE